MVKVSIIIPVYNAEKYIKRCLDTVINQSFKDLEVILINDGSTDNSLKILEEYKKNYSNITVINQKNSGQGEARNRGIEIAKGEYVTFADIDDWIDTDYVKVLYETIKENNCDISICNHTMVMSKSFREVKSKNFLETKLTGEDALRSLLLDKELKSYPWGKLYKKIIFTKNNIYFPGKMFYEDLAIIFKVFYYSSKITLVNKYCYYYFQSEDSSTRAPNPKTIYDRLTALTMVKEFLVQKNSLDKYRDEYIHFCLFHLYIMCRKINLWKLNITYKEITTKILNLINKRNINKKLLNKTKLTKKEKKELSLLKYPKVYDTYILYSRIFYKLKS